MDGNSIHYPGLEVDSRAGQSRRLACPVPGGTMNWQMLHSTIVVARALPHHVVCRTLNCSHHVDGCRTSPLVSRHASKWYDESPYPFDDRYRTIMSYACNEVPRVNYFSNPDVDYLGKPTGDCQNDNARAIEENMV